MLDFPNAPVNGQQYVAPSGVTYQWLLLAEPVGQFYINFIHLHARRPAQCPDVRRQHIKCPEPASQHAGCHQLGAIRHEP